MNPPNAPTNPATFTPPATALLSTRPPFILSLLRFLMALGAGITVLLSLAAYENFLPPHLAVYVGTATALLLALKEFITAAGDILDDGLKNDSFRLGLLALLLLPLAACATRPDGSKTFLALDAEQWGSVGLDAGKAAVRGAIPAYFEQRAKTPPPPSEFPILTDGSGK